MSVYRVQHSAKSLIHYVLHTELDVTTACLSTTHATPNSSPTPVTWPVPVARDLARDLRDSHACGPRLAALYSTHPWGHWWTSLPSRPSIRGMLGPQRSMSRMPTLRPAARIPGPQRERQAVGEAYIVPPERQLTREQ